MTTTANPATVIIERSIAAGVDPAQLLEQLGALGIEWAITDQGTLMVKSWQVVAERFVAPETVPNLQQPGHPAAEVDALNWVGAHLEELRAQYPGQWIAVAGGQVRANAPTLPALLALVNAQGLNRPFVTQIPAGEIIWKMAYAGQEF